MSLWTLLFGQPPRADTRRRCVRHKTVTVGRGLFGGGHKERRCAAYDTGESAKAVAQVLKRDDEARAWLKRDDDRHKKERAALRAQEAEERRAETLRTRRAAEDKRQRTKPLKVTRAGAGPTASATAAQLAKTQGGSATEWDSILRAAGVQLNPAQRKQRWEHACRYLGINPTAADVSEEFHGTRQFGRGGKVEIGRLDAIEYSAPRGSQRAGVIWRHTAGDRGLLRPKNTEVALLTADPKTGRVELEDRGMRFSPSEGLIG